MRVKREVWVGFGIASLKFHDLGRPTAHPRFLPMNLKGLNRRERREQSTGEKMSVQRAGAVPGAPILNELLQGFAWDVA